MVMDEKVKEIGRRARERLEIEKRKRKEIVRLDEQDAPAAGNGNATRTKTSKKGAGSSKAPASKFSKAVKQSGQARKSKSKPPPRKRKRPAATTTVSSIQKSQDGNHTIDPRVPITDKLLYQNLPTSEKSNLVRLHGLPIGTKSDHIRKFLSGLHPEQILILPSMNVPIDGFDALTLDDSESSLKRRRQEKGSVGDVDRYPSTFRVLVKFQNALTAETSIARSGEMIHVLVDAPHDTDADEQDGDNKRSAAAISISSLSNHVGTYLQNHMGIECPRGRVLSDVLNEAQEEMPPIMNQILWTMAEQKLQLGLKLRTIGSTRSGGDYPSIRTKDIFHIFPPVNNEGREHIVVLHNKLLDVYEKLEEQCSPLKFNAMVMDPSFVSKNSSDWLMHDIARWLLDQMDKIQRCIVHI
jgi:hypothetical protein